MLREDPIVLKYPQYLPTREEVDLAEALLRRPENRELWEALCGRVQIGGCPAAAVRRFCWQAREEGQFGDACAAGALEWARRCVATRRRLGMDTVLRSDVFSGSFRELYISTVPFSFHGTDRLGHPVYIVRYGSVDVAAFQRLWAEGEALRERAGLAVNGAVLFHLRNMEYMAQVVMAEESRRQGRVVDRLLAIADVGGLGLRHFDATVKAFLGAVAEFSVQLFPEVMHATIVTNAPWILARGAWPLVRPFLHPVTQSKVVILASARDVRDKLSELLGEGAVPSYFGGACACAECAAGVLSGGSMAAWERSEGLPASQGQLAKAPPPPGAAGKAPPPSRVTCLSACWDREWQKLPAKAKRGAAAPERLKAPPLPAPRRPSDLGRPLAVSSGSAPPGAKPGAGFLLRPGVLVIVVLTALWTFLLYGRR